MPFSKGNITMQMASAGGVSKTVAEKMFDAFVTGVTEALFAGERVSITGLGGFWVTERKAKKGHDPRTLEPLEIPARKVVKFSASGRVKALINDRPAEFPKEEPAPEPKGIVRKKGLVEATKPIPVRGKRR